MIVMSGSSPLSGLVSVFIPTRWDAVTGTFGDVRKRYERAARAVMERKSTRVILVS